MTDFKPTIIPTASEDFAATAADAIWDKISQIHSPLTALPTGSTPLDVYKHLLSAYGERKDVWGQVRYLSLDDYAGLEDDDERLFQNWLAREILDDSGITHRTTFNSNAADPAQETARMEQWIADNGPIDIVVLGLGTNGHIAFNEPGSSFESTTRIVPLSSETREANAAYWGGIDQVPTQAYTLGLKTLASAQHIFLLVSGAHKADILDKVLNGPITEDVPATVLRTVPNVTVIADKAALGLKP